jgi:hypothetical protein
MCNIRCLPVIATKMKRFENNFEIENLILIQQQSKAVSYHMHVGS